MEEEKQHFSRLMKDARRRFEDFLTNFEKSTPFLIRRMDHKYPKGDECLFTDGTNRHLYQKMSCESENSDENINVAKVIKMRSNGKYKKLKRRLRHSVIGTGKEFSDIDVMLLNESSEYNTCYDDGNGNKLCAEEALNNYISQLYSNDKKPTRNSFCANEKEEKSRYIVDEILHAKLSDRNASYINKADAGNNTMRMNNSNGLERIKARKNCRFPSYVARSRLASPGKSMYSDDSVVLTREQKRRVKEKMKLALKRPNNYSYLGNL